MKKIYTILSILLAFVLFSGKVVAQANAIDPTDPDVIFTSTNQPTQPAWNNYSILKWGHTNRLGWNPYSRGFKSYYYQGMVFRIKFPKTYVANVADGKKYPLFIFFHGQGELGTIYDNELQLLHGGEFHANAVDNGTFDGFLFYAQSTSGPSQDYFPRISNLIDSLVKNNKVDIDRVITDGLSAGGQATWEFSGNTTYAKKVAAMLPISAASTTYMNSFNNYLTIPIWVSNGGQDAGPAPYTVTQLVNQFRSLGGNIKQTLYPDQGHGVWNSFWNEPGYFSFINAAHKANPLLYFQRNQFCPTDAVNAKLALQAGFSAYQWDKNGVVIAGATTNELTVTTYGTYRGRFKRTATSAWSDWSPTPVVISQKLATVTPPIQINGSFSNVVPSPDGSTTTPLMVPNTYASYEWRNVSDNALVSSTNTYNAPVGQVKVKVTEQYGCSSSFSDPFTVIAANGTNVPDNITNFSGLAASSSSIRLDWNDNPTPINNETGFEVYRSTTHGSGYSLVATKGADVLTHTDVALLSNTTYYYIIRAVNANGAATVSNEIAVSTKSDIVAPTAPTNLRVTGTTRQSVSLAWDEATDDVGVYKYDVYVNGVKAYITSNTSVTVSNLTTLQTYGFYVKARDLAGNQSPQSNQVSGTAALQGLNYKYYHGDWNALPDFNTLTPIATGTSSNVDISVKQREDQFGFLWEGSINIPVTGSYTFETRSDDGSKLYIGTYNNASTALVNNDGLHGTQSATGTITLTAGVYPIAITFFEQGGGDAMEVYWQSTAAGILRQKIPNSAFSDNVTIPASSLPARPSNLVVSATAYNKAIVSWTDNSTNESGFEIARSTTLTGTFVPVGTTAANATSFVDTVGLDPVTVYFYKVRSINQYGQSAFISNFEAAWGFNSNYNDASGNNKTLTAGSAPTFNTTDKKEGTAAISLNGSNQFADMPFSTAGAFPSNAYTTRTLAMWIKPTSTMTSIITLNRIIADLGGADNGLALRFNSNSLQAGIASGSSRATAVVNSVASNASWISGGWNHVAVVYNVNTLKLFINGVEKASTNLSFSSVSSTTNSSRIGATNSSNAFNSSTSGTFYGGLIDDVEILNEPLAAAQIVALMNQSYGSDTTLALPAVPSVPTNNSITALSTSSIALKFNDNSNNETGFEVYRSVANTNNFRLLTTLAAGTAPTVTFTDADLFANTTYYYKVRAIGVGGSSAYTANVFAKTKNNIPVFTDVPSFAMRFDTQKTISIVATDVDVETLTLSAASLPSFAAFTSTGNGTGNLVLSPSAADQGVYPIEGYVTDSNGGKDTLSFTITVNSNYTPVFTPITNTTVNEGTSSSIAIASTDQDGNGTLTLSQTAPSFVTLTDNGSGSGTLTVAPGYGNAGVYNVTVTANDGAGGIENSTFVLTVNDVAPTAEKIYMNMKYFSANAPAPWNNIYTTNINNLLNSDGATTQVGISFLGTPWNAGDAGAVTGNDSGVYPDAVIKDYFWFGAYGAPETINFNLTGLVSSNKYNVTLFGSSAWTGLGNNGTTVYTINGVAKPLYVDNNNQNTVTFNNITPDASGNITVNLSKGANTPYGVLNAVVLEKSFDDGSTPILPTNFAGQITATGVVKLSWKDVAYNEDRYLVSRATAAAGPFTVINAGASNANDSTYTDNTALSSTSYFYKIEATNNNGTSGFTNVINVVTGNKPPVLTNINNQILKSGTTSALSITATDDAGDVLTTTVSNLPSFASYSNTGNGTGTITFSPSAADLGVYKNIIIKVADNKGAIVSDTIKVTVNDSDVRSVFVNFGNVNAPINQPAPWNNFMIFPYANVPLTSLKDDSDVTTSFSVKLQQQWEGNFSLGMITGDNSGIFPDNVLQSSIYTTSTAARGIQIDGLNPAKKYNVVFLSSHNAGLSSQVTFSSGAQSVTQESRYNSNQSVQLNGLSADASGTLVVNAIKGANAAYLNLNAMVIEEYTPSATTLLRPYYLFAESILDSGKVKLTWADKSDSETGFQIYRSTSLNGTYSLVTTTAANVTTYTNTGLSGNVRYFYKVRAIKAGVTSNYSNVASMVLAPKIVLINLNTTAAQIAPAPWNNTTGPSTAGATFSNLIDNTNSNSGIEMVITKEFNGPGFAGVASTTGIFPSVVMQSNYWTDAGQLSQVKFNNLDIRKKYRIGCFGSAIFQGYSFANYTCNGKLVQLNSINNDSKVVYLNDLTTDNGELVVDVRTVTGSPYSFTGAFTIEVYDDIPYTPVSFNGTQNIKVGDPTNMEIAGRGITTAVKPNATNTLIAETKVKAVDPAPASINVYPNPFTSRIDVELTHDKAASVSIMVYDLTSKLMYKSANIKQQAGYNKLSLNLPAGSGLVAGTYVVNVLIDGKPAKTVKLIKVN